MAVLHPSEADFDHDLPTSSPIRTHVARGPFLRRHWWQLAIVLIVVVAAFAWWAQGKGIKHRISVALFGPPARQPKPVLVITVQDTEPVDCDGNVPLDAVVRLQIDSRTGPVDPKTLSQDSATIVHSASQKRHPARVSLEDDGHTIVLTPDQPLLKDASYSVYVTLGVASTTGVPVRNFSMAFTTEGSFDPSIRFEKVKQELTTDTGFTCVQYGPDGALWTATDDGRIIRYEIAPDGNVHAPIVFDALQKANDGPRLISGFCFDPKAPADKPVIYVSHSFFGFEKVPDFTGKFTRMSGENLAQVQDLLIQLPRSYIDHLNFQPAFGPDGAIYFAVGSSSAFGAPDKTWGMRPEHPLTASVLRVDLAKLPAELPVDVKATAEGGYDPKAPGAPLTVYATGVRVAYDLVWHSNGKLYAPVNGSSSGGNSPEGPGAVALQNIPLSEHDWLMMIEPGRYYGHPNPTQGHYVLNGGNPTPAGDFAEVAQYPVGTQPDPLYTAPIHDFGKHVSANGAVEIKSSIFDGKLQGMLAVCRYNCGSDIMFIGFNPDGTVKNFRVGLEGTGDLASPLDVTENPNTGVLYVSEYAGRHITMLRPINP